MENQSKENILIELQPYTTLILRIEVLNFILWTLKFFIPISVIQMFAFHASVNKEGSWNFLHSVKSFAAQWTSTDWIEWFFAGTPYIMDKALGERDFYSSSLGIL